MGWDIKLIQDDEVVQVKPHMTGSNLVATIDNNGELVATERNDATACITYNYSQLYRMVDFDYYAMNGKKAKNTIKELERAIKKLGTKTYDNYWAPTPGNAGAALSQLLSWAKQHPEAIWEIQK